MKFKNPLMNPQGEPYIDYWKHRKARECTLTQVGPVKTPVDPNSKRLRTTSVEGLFQKLPTPGERFIMVSEPLDSSAGTRYISTSPVQKIVDKVLKRYMATYDFETENTIYRLEVPRA